jgi:hypothetical protein
MNRPPNIVGGAVVRGAGGPMPSAPVTGTAEPSAAGAPGFCAPEVLPPPT